MYGKLDDNDKNSNEDGCFLDVPNYNCPSCNSETMCEKCKINVRSSLLGFYRLIGCLYFRLAVKDKDKKPLNHFKNFKDANPGLTSEETQKNWLEFIRSKTIENSDKEDCFMPSLSALSLHWLRSI